MGLMGAVLAWLLRMLADTLLMFFFALATLKHSVKRLLDWKQVLVAVFSIASFAGMFLQSAPDRLVILSISIVTTYLLCWSLIFSQEDRVSVLKRVGCATG
jgi:Na+-driven multidrug efflux pump